MKRAWAAQMEVFQIVADICDRNGIRYFADWGTLLGAVRHKGMIPWDDDIDISLMRDEYNQLIKILPEQLPHGFVIAGMYADSKRLQDAAFVPQLRVIADETLWNFNDYMKFFMDFHIRELVLIYSRLIIYQEMLIFTGTKKYNYARNEYTRTLE